MFKTLISLIVSLSLSMGGATVTMAAAQDSLPGEALYSIKTAGESVQLAMADEPRQFGLLLEFSQRRLEEMFQLMQAGEEVPAEVQARLGELIDNALKLAARLGEQEMPGCLEQLRLQLQEQERLMQQLHEQDPQHEDPLQIREMLQQRLRLVNDALANPDAFRAHFGDDNVPGFDREPGTGSQNGAGGDDELTPGKQDGSGEKPADAPKGPCPNEEAGCADLEDKGPGTGPGPNEEPGPGDEPGPGEQEGPGPGPDETKDPAYNAGDNDNGNNGGDDTGGSDNGGGEDNGGGTDNGGGSDNGGGTDNGGGGSDSGGGGNGGGSGGK